MAHLVLSASLFTTVSRCDVAFVAIKVCLCRPCCAPRAPGRGGCHRLMRLFEAVGSHGLELAEVSGGSERGLCTQDGFAASVLVVVLVWR